MDLGPGPDSSELVKKCRLWACIAAACHSSRVALERVVQVSMPDEELEATRQRGYAIDDEEFEEGIRAVSAPIRDIEGNVVAALSMPGPANRMPPQRVSEIADALVETANAISGHVLRQ